MDFSLIPGILESFVLKGFAFLLCLSIIVFIHEFGHYFIAKLCGIHSEVFSLGFGPVLFSFSDKQGTKWQVAAIPLGGYVKFLGDKNIASAPKINEKDNDLSNYRSTIHGAPLWARFLTVSAGPVFNFLLSIVIFFLIYMDQGITKVPVTVHKLFEMPYQQKLVKGDIIKSINDIEIESNLNSFAKELEETSISNFVTYFVERDKSLIKLENVNQNPPLIAQVLPKSAAISAGLRKGDVILSINSKKINNFAQIKGFVEASDGKALKIEYWRKGVINSTELNPLIVDVPQSNGDFERIYRVGIVGEYFPFEPVSIRESPWRAALNSAQSTYSIIEGSIKGVYHIIIGNISRCNLSGPISIAETSGQMVQQGGLNFLWFIAVLSTAIGMINLFPIPALDGGHLMFFAFEAVLRKKPNPSMVNGFMTFGFFVLLGLMAFSLFNDVLCY